MADGIVAALSPRPSNPRWDASLDYAMWTNQVRLIYLHRMLEATERTAGILDGKRTQRR